MVNVSLTARLLTHCRYRYTVYLATRFIEYFYSILPYTLIRILLHFRCIILTRIQHIYNQPNHFQ